MIYGSKESNIIFSKDLLLSTGSIGYSISSSTVNDNSFLQLFSNVVVIFSFSAQALKTILESDNN